MAYSRPTAPPSGSAKCLRFAHWLTLCTLNMHLLTYLLTYTTKFAKRPHLLLENPNFENQKINTQKPYICLRLFPIKNCRNAICPNSFDHRPRVSHTSQLHSNTNIEACPVLYKFTPWHFGMTKAYKKLELMLTRHTKAYSSSGSVV